MIGIDCPACVLSTNIFLLASVSLTGASTVDRPKIVDTCEICSFFFSDCVQFFDNVNVRCVWLWCLRGVTVDNGSEICIGDGCSFFGSVELSIGS